MAIASKVIVFPFAFVFGPRPVGHVGEGFEQQQAGGGNCVCQPTASVSERLERLGEDFDGLFVTNRFEPDRGVGGGERVGELVFE